MNGRIRIHGKTWLLTGLLAVIVAIGIAAPPLVSMTQRGISATLSRLVQLRVVLTGT